MHINKSVINKEFKDSIVWGGDTTGNFSVKSAYARLANQNNEAQDGVLCSLWQARAMPKALITAWRILLDRIPTYVNLLRRGVTVNSSICVLCIESEETTQHLF